MDLSWGKPVAATDDWAGVLDGALVAPDSRHVTHLVAKRGLFFSKRFVIPMKHLRRRARDGIYLDVELSVVLGLPFLKSGDKTDSGANLSRCTRVTLSDGTTLRLRGLRMTDDNNTLTNLVVDSPGVGRLCVLVPADERVELGSNAVDMDIRRQDLKELTVHRADDDVGTELWEVLYASEEIPDVDLKGIRAYVVDGVITLEGNVRAPSTGADVERLAGSVRGVAGVDNRLVDDWNIVLQAASFVYRTSPQLAGEVVVHAQLGNVSVKGLVPSADTKLAIVEGLRLIQGVRRAEDLLEVRVQDEVQSERLPVTDDLSLPDARSVGE